MLDGVFSLKFGPSPFEWSLFTDTELDTCEPDLLVRTQRPKRGKIHLTTGHFSSYIVYYTTAHVQYLSHFC